MSPETDLSPLRIFWPGAALSVGGLTAGAVCGELLLKQ